MSIITADSAFEQYMVLHDIRWQTYELLLVDNADRSSLRMTYDNGLLEMIVPSLSHGEDNRNLAAVVDILCEEWAIPFRSLGGMTFKREDLARGFEPDSCFYIQSFLSVRGNGNIDLAHDPPPDLIIEIDITSISINKLPIYAQLGVREIWRYQNGIVRILVLANDSYGETGSSLAFSRLTASVLNTFMEDSHKIDRHLWLRSVRTWARHSTEAAEVSE